MKNETAILKCIAKGCKNKVIIKLKITDSNNAAALFFKFCNYHQKLFDNKVKTFNNEQVIKATVKNVINDTINKKKKEDK